MNALTSPVAEEQIQLADSRAAASTTTRWLSLDVERFIGIVEIFSAAE